MVESREEMLTRQRSERAGLQEQHKAEINDLLVEYRRIRSQFAEKHKAARLALMDRHISESAANAKVWRDINKALDREVLHAPGNS